MSSNKILLTIFIILGICILYIFSLGPIAAMVDRGWISNSWLNLYMPLFSIQAYFTTYDYLMNYASWFVDLTGSSVLWAGLDGNP